MPHQFGEDGMTVLQYFEQRHLRAYPDSGSLLARELQRQGLWRRVVAGTLPIPNELRHLPGHPWTCGWGDTGKHVTAKTVYSIEEADARLHMRLAGEFVPGVLDVLHGPNPTQRQLDALVEFAYNVGLPQFRSSTLLRMYNHGDLAGAAEQFLRWTLSKGKHELGLWRRRCATRFVFLGGSGAEAVVLAAAISELPEHLRG